MIGIILIITGFLMIIVGVVVFIKSTTNNVTNTSLSQENKPKVNKIETEPIDQDQQNGINFEKYVVQKFNKRFFTLKEWTGDKYINGIYAESTLHPDLHFEFKLNDITTGFAVECKWRKRLYKNGVELAKLEQLKRYRKYENEKKLPVFIVIGLQGNSSNPESLYIIPVKDVNTTFLTIDTLKKYEKDKTQNFFFDPNKQNLK